MTKTTELTTEVQPSYSVRHRAHGWGWAVYEVEPGTGWGSLPDRRTCLKSGWCSKEETARTRVEHARAEVVEEKARNAAWRAEKDASIAAQRAIDRAADAEHFARSKSVSGAMGRWVNLAELKAKFGADAVEREINALCMLGRFEASGDGTLVKIKDDPWTGD
jgi:hypothetical protein